MVSEVSPLVRFVRSTFGFRKTTVTLITVLSYVLSVLIASYSQYEVNQPPIPEPAILTDSWYDLQILSERFHPYDSHANDQVHDHIAKRAKQLAGLKPYIDVHDMYGEQSLFRSLHADSYHMVQYFEDGNVLVKVEGKDPSLPGVLVSAHYDSVPTAHGTTDDGMGIASMLGVLQALATEEDQPERTVVFNFNNNEEFGLLGAQTFFNHKWSKLVSYFINLEGTGTGDRAILFRATDSGVASFYGAAPRPFASSLFQEGFESRLILSETDYKIYKKHGMRGLDIAFYKPRNLYHTPRDSISSVSKGSLWHMESSTLEVLKAMAYSAEPISDDESPAVFFDILGTFYFSFSIDTVYAVTVASLVVVPLIFAFLLAIVLKRETWHISLLKGWFRVPLSFAISSVAVFAFGKVLLFQNPLVLSNNWFSACVALTSSFLFINYLILNFFAWARPMHDQKLVALLEVTFLLWAANVWMAVKEKTSNNVAGFALVALYLLTASSALFGLVVMAVKSKSTYAPLPKPAYGATESEGSSGTVPNPEEIEAESTPLLTPQETETHDDEYKHALHSFHYDWLLQFLIVAPLSILIVYLTGDLLLQGLNQTSEESAKLGAVTMKFLSIFTIMLGLPVLPFVHKFNALLAFLLVITIATSSIIAFVEPPFSYSSPLKIRFLQSIDISGDKEPVVKLRTRRGYLTDVLQDIPSIKHHNVTVSCSTTADDLETCEYIGLRPWLVDGSHKVNAFDKYLDVEVLNRTGDGKYSPYDAELKIWAQQNRNCLVQFNTSSYSSADAMGKLGLESPVKQITVFHDATNATAHVYKSASGVDEAQLHKVDWDEPYYHLGLKWTVPWDSEDSGDLGVTVKCYWGEYDTDSNVDGEPRRKVPAFEELVGYSPSSVVYSNLAMGFVEISKTVNV